MLKKISIFTLVITYIINPIPLLNSLDLQKNKKTNYEYNKVSKQKIHFKEETSVDEKIKKLENTIEKKKNELIFLEKKLKKLKEETKTQKDAKVSNANQVFYDLGSGLGKVTIHAYLYDQEDLDKAKKFIQDEYEDIRAEISDEERTMVGRNKMGSPVYGEIQPDSFEKILKDPDLNIKGFKKCVGIELSPTRHHHAVTITKKLKEKNLEIENKYLEFKNENIADSNINDADVIFMCSTCFPDELMEVLVNKFTQLKNGLIVITLKSLPNFEVNNFKLMKEISLPMTWSEASPVYIYKLNKS